MSLVSHQMVMRATVRRHPAAKDSYGQKKAAAAWEIIAGAMPIYFWIEQEDELVEGRSIVVEKIRGYVRHTADVKRGDELLDIKDRRERTIFEGTFVVDAVADKKLGASPSHKVLSLRRHLA